MNTDQSPESELRAAFEAWLQGLDCGYSIQRDCGGDAYAFHDEAQMWIAYQAGHRRAQEWLPDEQLMRFYSADTVAELIAAMERHIDGLQAKLPRDSKPLVTRVREG